MFVHICMHIYFAFSSSVKSLVPILRTASFLDRTVWGKSYIAGVGGVDSSYLSLVTPAISDYGDSDYPALLVFMEYLCALEVSPM